jgi:hypothetical protein
MTALVLCPCGHAIDVHEPGGCRGDRASRCACALTPIEAMDAAVDGARSSYVHDHRGDALRERDG